MSFEFCFDFARGRVFSDLFSAFCFLPYSLLFAVFPQEVFVESETADGHLLLSLRLCLHGKMKNIRFPFVLATDTVETVAAEMR